MQSAKAVIVNEGTVLLLRSSGGKGWWDLPGGRVEADEGMERALAREVTEEIGAIHWNIIGAPVAHSYALPQFGIPAITGNFFPARFEHGEIVLSREHDQYAWVPFGEIDSWNLAPYYKRPLRTILHQYFSFSA